MEQDSELMVEFNKESGYRDWLTKRIRACNSIEELIKFFERLKDEAFEKKPDEVAQFAGETELHSIPEIITELKAFPKRISQYLNTKQSARGDQQIIWSNYLKEFTRAYGLRRKVAELGGIVEFFENSFFDGES